MRDERVRDERVRDERVRERSLSGVHVLVHIRSSAP